MSQARNSPIVSSLAKFFVRTDVGNRLRRNSQTEKTIGRIVFNELPDMEHLKPLFELYKKIISGIDLQLLEELTIFLQSNDSSDLITSAFDKMPPKLKAWIYLVYANVILDLFTLRGNLRIGVQEALKDFSLEETKLSINEMHKAFFIGYSQHIAACTVPKSYENDQEEMSVEQVAALFVTSAIEVKCKELIAKKKSIGAIREKVGAELFKINDEGKIQNEQLNKAIKFTLAILYCSELNKFYEANEAMMAYETAQIKLQEVANNENATSQVLAKAAEIYQKIERPLNSNDIKKIYLLACVLNATAEGFRDSRSISKYESLIMKVEQFDGTKPLVASMLVVLTFMLIAASIFSIILTGGGAIPFFVAGLFALSAASSLGSSIYLFKRGNDTVQLANLTRAALLPEKSNDEESLSSSRAMSTYK